MSRFETLLIALALANGFLTAPSSSWAQAVTEEWVVRYDGTGSGDDRAQAIAVDALGGVYVTGASWGDGTFDDYATTKYDGTGKELWVARYDGRADGDDWPRAIAVDSFGAVYVTGASFNRDLNADYVTIKYDASGEEVWVARYNGPGDDVDYAMALAVDGSGNVYVTGLSAAGARFDDYATIKYDAAGNELWVARYDGGSDGDDWPSDISVDSSGNVYVTGRSWRFDTGFDFVTIKYAAAGTELWAARYDGPGSGTDVAWALDVDGAGNVYVTGWSRGSGTDTDYATIKYGPTGNELWVMRYNGPGNDFDAASDIAVDESGNAWVTGVSRGDGTHDDYATVKYDAHGNELWAIRYNGPGNDADGGSRLIVDASGHVYVTGYSRGRRTRYDYATIKYDAAGDELWVARYNGPGNSYDEGIAIALDASGNVYTTGSSTGAGTLIDFATIKYSQRVSGDLNCDGQINAFDIEPFLVALFDPKEYAVRYPECDINLADINGDGSIDAFDIEPFLNLLFP